MKAWLSLKMLNLFGWSLRNVQNLSSIPKSIVCVVPHTSNWDFPIGIFLRNALHTNVVYMGKASLFKPPFGAIFKWLGGIPVERSKSTNLVDTVVKMFNDTDELRICIAPEGTRSKVDKLKTGFYWMAKKSGVPIILTKWDGKNRVVGFDEIFYPGEDPDADLTYISNYFKGVKGIVPENSF